MKKIVDWFKTNTAMKILMVLIIGAVIIFTYRVTVMKVHPLSNEPLKTK